ncbi:transcription factor 24-like [Corythoichthys intestinalis]|uniref:transcription factor 24-like n=1 Tax=Corythoichthys intestinalis TaxID=161448 RepID=UPI0025A4D092|nr:transcription factor 24-like [Corythoichthys intestinalis]XP_061806815.1 transcription factor 24-like [Nerophis lumbriciformis]
MAGNPLESLMSVAISHRPAEPESHGASTSRSPACLQRRKHGIRSNRELCYLVPSACGSGSNTSNQTLPKSTSGSHHSPVNAARERSRVRNLRQAFHSLQAALPSVPRDTKLSKLDVLILATNYIAYLTQTLDQGRTLAEHTLPPRPGGYLHPVKKWPMRSLLYCGSVGEVLSGVQANQDTVHLIDQGDKEC